jgi:hypothetical protein
MIKMWWANAFQIKNERILDEDTLLFLIHENFEDDESSYLNDYDNEMAYVFYQDIDFEFDNNEHEEEFEFG